MNKIKEYKWMKPFQLELYNQLCQEFDFTSLTDIGDFLGLKNPYHGARLIFEAQKQNIYLKKMVNVKQKDNDKIRQLENNLNSINNFKGSIENLVDNLNISLQSIKEIKNKIK